MRYFYLLIVVFSAFLFLYIHNCCCYRFTYSSHSLILHYGEFNLFPAWNKIHEFILLKPWWGLKLLSNPTINTRLTGKNQLLGWNGYRSNLDCWLKKHFWFTVLVVNIVQILELFRQDIMTSLIWKLLEAANELIIGPYTIVPTLELTLSLLFIFLCVKCVI